MNRNKTIEDILSLINEYHHRMHIFGKSTHSYGTHHQLRQDQIMLIDLIGRNPDCNLLYLAGAVGSGVPTVSLQVDRLREMGLVDKCRSSVSKRELQLSLTEAGQQAFRTLQERSTQFFSDVALRLEGFSQEELAAIFRFLSGMMIEEPNEW